MPNYKETTMNLHSGKKIAIICVTVLAVFFLVLTVVNWEIGNAKKHIVEKAKQVEITPRKNR